MEYVIPIWRRYHRPVLYLILCAGLVALIAGNMNFWRQKIADQPVPIAEVNKNLPEETTASPVRPRVAAYVVVPGDNLEEIARKHGIDVDTILGANPELNSETIYPGQRLNILAEKGVLHIVADGQTFWSIARQYGMDWQRIESDNPGVDIEALQPGQRLFIRGAKPRRQNDVSRGSTDLYFRRPAQGVVSSPFGYRWGTVHTGIDIAADNGEAIQAARGGRVAYAGWMGGYGLTVVIDHGRGWETLYGHASEVFVNTGDMVQAGKCIAAVGSTGNSTGPHLHFEVRKQGTPLNPAQYLQ